MTGIFQEQSDLERLVERCRRQDGQAWSELVQRFQNLVYSIARRYRLSEEDAVDVFQTTFIALYRSLDRIDEPQTLPKWLAVTASREALKLKRIGDRTYHTDDHGFSLEEVVAHEEASAEENAISALRSDEIRNAIHALAEKCRKLLSLLYLEEDVPYQEISDLMGMPMGAIGPTRARCLQKLRKNLETAGFF